MYDESISCFRKALVLKAELPDALSNLVHTLQILCDWSGLREHFPALVQMVEQQLHDSKPSSVQPFHALGYPVSPQMMLRIARSYAARIISSAALIAMPPPLRPPGQRLCVGYMSSDFMHHPLAHLMLSVRCTTAAASASCAWP